MSDLKGKQEVAASTRAGQRTARHAAPWSHGPASHAGMLYGEVRGRGGSQ